MILIENPALESSASVLTIAEVAGLLGLSQRSVRRRIQSGSLRARRISHEGREILVVAREELELAACPLVAAVAPPPADPGARSGVVLSALGDAHTAGVGCLGIPDDSLVAEAALVAEERRHSLELEDTLACERSRRAEAEEDLADTRVRLQDAGQHVRTLAEKAEEAERLWRERLARVDSELGGTRARLRTVEAENALLAARAVEDARLWSGRLRAEIGHKKQADELAESVFSMLEAVRRREGRVLSLGLALLLAVFSLALSREREQRGAFERLEGALLVTEARAQGATVEAREAGQRLELERNAHERALGGLEAERERLREELEHVRAATFAEGSHGVLRGLLGRLTNFPGAGLRLPLLADRVAPGTGP